MLYISVDSTLTTSRDFWEILFQVFTSNVPGSILRYMSYSASPRRSMSRDGSSPYWAVRGTARLDSYPDMPQTFRIESPYCIIDHDIKLISYCIINNNVK